MMDMESVSEHLMGRIVTVTKIVKRHKTSDEVKYVVENLKEPRSGWVTGIRFLNSGSIERDYEYGCTFIPDAGKKSLPVVLVAFYPNLNPVRVPLDGYRYFSNGDKLPHSNAYQWTDKEKEEMSLISGDFERDEKGRFV